MAFHAVRTRNTQSQTHVVIIVAEQQHRIRIVDVSNYQKQSPNELDAYDKAIV